MQPTKLFFNKCFFVIFSIILLTSCGLVKTAYNNAPALTIWWLDDYFGFNQAQTNLLKPALQKLHNWHRKEQLPTYLKQLQNIQNALANERISADGVCEQLTIAKQSLHVLQMEAVPIIIEIAPSLNEQQLLKFKQKLIKRAQKWQAEWYQDSKQAQVQVRQTKAIEFAEKVFGNLNNDQITLLNQNITMEFINPAISFKEIERRNNDAVNILKSLKNDALGQQEKITLLRAGFDRLQKSPDENYQTYANLLTQHSCNVIADLHATTSPAQKLHAKKWLNDYIEQLTTLQTALN